MRGVFSAIVLSVAFFQVAAVPLKALVGDGSPGNIAKIKEATEIANQHIKNAQAVLKGPHPESHPALIKAFGKNANVAEIKKNFNALEGGKLKVPNAAADPRLTQGATDTRTKEVAFGSTFFSSSGKDRAGTVIHEAAHAIHGAVDHFDKNGNPHPQGTAFDRSKAQVGYKDSHLEQLKKQASHNMHHNADSYRVFAEECPQARELFRRALQETNPAAQSHLVRRAARACAYRPKGASKVAATKLHAKAAAKKASGRKVAKPVAKKAGSRRPSGAKAVKTASRATSKKVKRV